MLLLVMTDFTFSFLRIESINSALLNLFSELASLRDQKLSRISWSTFLVWVTLESLDDGIDDFMLMLLSIMIILLSPRVYTATCNLHALYLIPSLLLNLLLCLEMELATRKNISIFLIVFIFKFLIQFLS